MKIYQNTNKSTIYRSFKKLTNFVIKNQITVNKPVASKNDYNHLKKSISELEISTYGKFTSLFENEIKKFTKSKFVLSTNSGTSGLHLSLLALNLNQGHEVFLPSFNFISSANAIRYCNAIPHFLDIDLDNLGVDPDKLDKHIKKNFIFENGKLINKKTRKHLKAIILVYSYGHPPKIKELLRICNRYKIKVIEDSAEALGTFYNKKHAGTFGDFGILSFNGNKIITTGAGGAILTNSKILFKKVLALATLAKKENRIFDYKFLGYNYRMASINASLGLSQIKDINKRILVRRNLYKKYKKVLSNFEGGDLFAEPKNAKSNYWVQLLILNDKYTKFRDHFLKILNKKNVNSIQGWNMLNQLNYLKKFPKADLSNSKKISKSIINLPSLK